MKKTDTPIPEVPTLITLLRHGEVAGRADVLRGASEEKLSAQGVLQMQHALIGIGGAPYDHIATSPLPRCLNFAQDYAAQQGLNAQVLPCFGELNFGDWEGLTPSEAHARNPADYENFQATHGVHPPPQGESLDALRVRVLAGWQACLTQHEGTNRLLITHAGVIRALLMELFGFTPAQTFQIALPLAATVRISHLPGHAPFLLSINQNACMTALTNSLLSDEAQGAAQ